MTSIILSSLLMTGFMNTPYPNQFTVIPSMEVRYEADHWYVSQKDSARDNPDSLDTFNPITAKWQIEAGLKYAGITIGAGHYSEHGIDKKYPATESANYLRLEFRKDFR